MPDSSEVTRILNQATAIADTGFLPVEMKELPYKGKSIFRIEDLSTRIILNRVSKILRMTAGVKQTDRTTTIRRIARLLAEGAAHRVYKFDVQSFYESIDLHHTWDYIDNLPTTDRQTSRLLRSFVDFCGDKDISGAPRGLAVSAVLAEMTLRQFDAQLRSLPCTYFYARYVDDILLVTPGTELISDLKKQISDLLPPGLRFHPLKSQNVDLKPYKKSSPQVESNFDFLGYSISVSEIRRATDDRLYRSVRLDIALKKIARLKTRLAKATLQLLTDGKFTDFEDRIKFLSGNYNIVESRWKRRINVGLYCNYRLVDAETSSSLPAMDKFYHAWVLGYGGALSARLEAALTPAQKARLVTYSFATSFKARRFYHFNAARLREIRECWVYA